MKAEQTSSPALLPFEVNKKRQGKGKGKEGKEGKDGKSERRRTTIREIIEITGEWYQAFRMAKGKMKKQNDSTVSTNVLLFFGACETLHYLLDILDIIWHPCCFPRWTWTMFHQNSHQFRSLVLNEWTWGTSWILWPWIWNDQCKHTSKLLCKCCLADQFVCPRRVERTVCLGTYRKDNSWWYLMTDLKCILHIVKYKRFHSVPRLGTLDLFHMIYHIWISI